MASTQTVVASAQPLAGLPDLLAPGLRLNGIHRVLQTVRKYLGMDVVFISRIREHDRVMEHVDADGRSPIYAGQVIPLEVGYCRRLMLGELPELIPDTSLLAETAFLPETLTVPIGAHLGVPIRLSDGSVYGNLCCISYLPDPSLGQRDLMVVKAFADVLASNLEEASQAAAARRAKLRVVRQALESPIAPRIVYQPIYSLRSGTLVGMECLSRFDLEIPLTTNSWFALAEEVGLRKDLELLAIQRSLVCLDAFPSDIHIGLNCSPLTVLSGELAPMLPRAHMHRIVLEITEHSIVADYPKLVSALHPLREMGLRVAIDDAGAGYASMRHILSLSPDFIKLDMSLTSRIDKDPVRRALARALISFAEETHISITAEGIETPGELEVLRSLGVDMGQGFYLQEPLPLERAESPNLRHHPINTDQILLNMQG